ncbi:hypothetical protein OG357_11415 [Streptomyces sp. NBC_01255]|uniref:hypothetical protein n=1 Tax=Streptomyces sp. NBC_01255 TaxID=2903798 RepID=UPI002E308988|nr:hypothetical protein [Streptomyces sp. NBC_01255]
MDITKTDAKIDEKTAEPATEPAAEAATEDSVAAEASVEPLAAQDDEPAASDASDDHEPADDEPADDELLAEEAAASSGVGAGGAAVVSAALGAVALTGTWTGKVVSERETLIGQINSQSAAPAQQISEIYGDAWHSTALVNGVFALLALVTAVLVLVLARPDRPVWVRAVAIAGAVLGGLGLLLSVGTYFDLFLSLPTTGS